MFLSCPETTKEKQANGEEFAKTPQGKQGVYDVLQGNKLLQYLPKSQLLEEPGVAEQFLATASRLLEFAVGSGNHGAPDALHQGSVTSPCHDILYDATLPCVVPVPPTPPCLARPPSPAPLPLSVPLHM